MPRFAANLSMMYVEHAFLERFAAAAGDGFEAVEYLFPYEWPADTLAATLKQTGVQDHMSLGTAKMTDVVAALQRNHCEGPDCTASKMGRDGKIQLNMYDPDLTRVEFMEFQPSGKPCCSPILGKAPSEQEDR